MLRTDVMRGSFASRVLFVLAMSCVSARRADAGETEAAVHFATASKAFERADFEVAARAFELAYGEAPHPAPLYNAGLAWLGANRADHAADVFGVALSMDGLSPEQKLDATKRLEAAEKQLATLKLSGVPAGAKARIDDGPTLPATARFHAPLGEHEVFAIQEDGTSTTRKVKIDKADGSEVAVSFEIVEPNSRAATGGRPFDTKLAIGLGLLGGAVVFGAAAIGTGSAGLEARDDYVAALDTGSSGLAALRDDAVSLKVATNVLWGFSAATLVGGGVLAGLGLFGPKSGSTAIFVTPGGVTVHARF